jgi:uncharacterized protein YbcV (DUF1398 family)
MFTIEQITTAQSKVETGQDFTNYIQEIIALGVKGYETFVVDGRVEYFGSDDFCTATTAAYNPIEIANTVNKERFIEYLVMHQEGQTDYFTFCYHAGVCGIAKWKVTTDDMTCTYLDLNDAPILIEKISN